MIPQIYLSIVQYLPFFFTCLLYKYQPEYPQRPIKSQMQHFDNQDIRLLTKILSIEHSKVLTEQQKIHQISILKTSQPAGTDSSPKTIVGITNCMVGSAMIIYPVLFVKSGIIISPLVMILVASIQYVTCRLLVLHNRPDQPTYNQSILRIGGARLDRLNSIVNMLLFLFVCVAYFILITHNFYEVSSALLSSILPYNPPGSNQITFFKYSIQYSAILTFLALRKILFLKQIDFILKLMGYSMYCISAYAIFILLNLIRHVVQGNIHISQFRFFNPDFSSVAGAFALSFLVHPMAAPILKRNVDLKNNSRDLLLGYSLGATICFYVGFMGGLSCAPEVPSILAYPQKFSTIFDCVSSTSTPGNLLFYVFGKLVQAGILFQNFSVLPIMIFLTRNQFIALVGRPKLRDYLFEKFTWFYLIFSAFIAILAIDVSAILSLDGAVIGFFMGYGIPIYIHLKCLFHKFTAKENTKRKQLLQSLLNQSILGEGQHELQLEPQALECNKHEPVNKLWTYCVYGTILFCGVALGFFKLSSVFS